MNIVKDDYLYFIDIYEDLTSFVEGDLNAYSEIHETLYEVHDFYEFFSKITFLTIETLEHAKLFKEQWYLLILANRPFVHGREFKVIVVKYLIPFLIFFKNDFKKNGIELRNFEL